MPTVAIVVPVVSLVAAGRGPSTVAGSSAIGGAGSTGGGGSGAYSDETTTVRNGGKGGDGFVLITEYIAAP